MTFTLAQYFGGGKTYQPSAAFRINWRNARYQRIEPQVASLVGTLASALRGRPGLSLRIYNGGVHTFTLKDHAGNTLASIPMATLWELHLRDATTAAGAWYVTQL